MLQKIDTLNLQIGMYVAELDRPWLETRFLFQGFPITSRREIRELQRCCRYVFIDVRKSTPADEALESGAHTVRFSTRALNVAPERRRAAPADPEALVRELRTAREIHRSARRYMVQVMHDARLGHTLDVEQARSLVGRMADSIVRNSNALAWLSQIKSRDEYTLMHSINVCILSLLFGHFLGIERDELHDLGLGALLHDIGKVRVPLTVLNKPDRLTPAEWADVRRHPDHGYAILRAKGGIPERALEVVRGHHERVDGSAIRAA